MAVGDGRADDPVAARARPSGAGVRAGAGVPVVARGPVRLRDRRPARARRGVARRRVVAGILAGTDHGIRPGAGPGDARRRARAGIPVVDVVADGLRDLVTFDAAGARLEIRRARVGRRGPA
jgi:hypothetical protein